MKNVAHSVLNLSLLNAEGKKSISHFKSVNICKKSQISWHLMRNTSQDHLKSFERPFKVIMLCCEKSTAQIIYNFLRAIWVIAVLVKSDQVIKLGVPTKP